MNIERQAFLTRKELEEFWLQELSCYPASQDANARSRRERTW
jgi:hypothetical protein